MRQLGAVYVYYRLTDSGKPVELFVPHFVPNVDDVSDFATSVLAVAETVESFERRDREAVLADMLATDPTPAPRTPSVPAT